jgi:hypothetical protein
MVSTMQRTENEATALRAPARDELRAGNKLWWLGPALHVLISGNRLVRISKFVSFLA